MTSLLGRTLPAFGLALLALPSVSLGQTSRLDTPPGSAGAGAFVRFALAGQSAAEGASTVAVEVQLSAAMKAAVVVPYQLAGTAVPGVDYFVDQPSPLVFRPQQTSVILNVTLLDDDVAEATEEIILRLKKPAGVSLGTPKKHVLQIEDDDEDAPPVLGNVVATPTPDGAWITWTTNELATSRVEYGNDAGYGSAVFDPTLVTTHGLLVQGLESGTLQHFRVCSADAGGNTSCSPDGTFQTSSGPMLVSDDFNHPNLDRGIWQWVDPLAGDGQLIDRHAQLRLVGAGTVDARLQIAIPAGVSYLPWLTNGAARVRQTIPNEDFEVELKIESNLTAVGQTVGFFVEESAARWLRFDFYHTGSALTVVRASFQTGVASNFKQSTVQSGPWNGAPIWLRVARIGNQWVQRYSFDGVNFVSHGSSFNFPAVVGAVGVMAGNDTPSSVAFTAAIDYVSNLAAPITQDDVGIPSDATSPFVYANAGRAASDSSIRVSWGTDERSTSTLVWGLAAGVYDKGSLNGDAGVFYGDALVGGLLAGTTYHFQVRAHDLQGNPVTFGPDFTVTTGEPGSGGAPVIDVWYGQLDSFGDVVTRFGRPGMGQRWANVLGNVHDDSGSVVSLSYTLNGGAPKALSIGAGGFTLPYRLVSKGDFNVEIKAALLHDDAVGLNEVWITAVDVDGYSASKRVWIDYDADSVWPGNFAIDWSTVTGLTDVVQIVDGAWEIDPDSGYGGTPALRNSRSGVSIPGYDRLFLVGDGSWDDYEFTVPVTVHALNPAGFYPSSGSHAIGVIQRWPGHSSGSQQPLEGFFPFGGLFAYRWYEPGVNENWQAYGTGYKPRIDYPDFFVQVQIGVTYIFKGRCQTQPSGQTVYRMKAWEVTAPEPPDWFGEMTTPAGGLGAGSLLFLAHEVDASFGNITTVPLN